MLSARLGVGVLGLAMAARSNVFGYRIRLNMRSIRSIGVMYGGLEGVSKVRRVAQVSWSSTARKLFWVPSVGPA